MILIQSAIIFCIGLYSTIYIVKIKQGRLKPILATWTLFSLATILSVITDFSEDGGKSLMSNFFNIIDTIATITIFAVIARQKGIRKEFTLFEKRCIGAVLIVFVGWLISRQNIIAHLSIQFILVIAYLPTLVHLWNAKQNTESLFMWFLNFTASFFGVIVPLRTMDFLPLIYGLRSLLSTFTVIILILRLKYNSQLFRVRKVSHLLIFKE